VSIFLAKIYKTPLAVRLYWRKIQRAWRAAHPERAREIRRRYWRKKRGYYLVSEKQSKKSPPKSRRRR